MRSLSLRTLLAVGLLSGPAAAQSLADEERPWYLQFGVGRTLPIDSDAPGGEIAFKDGFALSALLGREVGHFGSDDIYTLSLEGELFFYDHEVKADGLLEVGSSSAEDTSTNALLVNAVFERQLSPWSSIYVGGGVGYALAVDFDSFLDGLSAFTLRDEDGFAYQAKAGLNFHLGGTYSAQLGWRYFATEDLTLEDASLGQSFEFENATQVLELGLRWSL